MKNKLQLTLILFLSSFISFACASDDSLGIEIENAWIAEAPPVSKVMVAYMTISNTGTQDIEIRLAQSKRYSSIEFHETVHEDGMARMVRHEVLTIKAGQKLELKRGGPHLMLFNPTKHLKAGDSVNISFTSSKEKSKTFSIPVVKPKF